MAVTDTDDPTHELVAGRYRLVERLGSGAMGEVWRAYDERLDRTVAIKQLLPAAGLGPVRARQGNERAMREARITAKLQHPHAVAVHDVVEQDGHPCLVMEYVPAQNLSAVLAQRRALPAAEVARLGQQVAAALAAAHAAGIVHRDVKPDNVLLPPDGGAKITDFGISRAVGDGSMTGPGVVVGTPAYLAPEIAEGGAATYASDVFSLGSTLYEAVEGTAPFGYDDNTIVLLQKVADCKVPPPTHAGPLGPVLMWLLRRDPASRPTMSQAADALGAVAAGQEVTPPASTLFLTRHRPRRRAVFAGLAALGLVAAGVITGVVIGSGGRSTGAVAFNRPSTAHTRVVPPPTTTTTPPDVACVADYAIVNAWPNGFQAQVTVKNATGIPVHGWQVTWSLPDGQTITQVWNGALTQTGTSVTVANLGYNAAVSANGSTTFGFLGGLAGRSVARPVVHCAAMP
jgi:serine/threonine protein kinase